MNQPIPPPVLKKSSMVKTIIAVLFAFLLIFIVIPSLIFVFLASSIIFKTVMGFGEIHFISYTDRFNVTVLELKSEPDYFEEKVRIKCERDMTAGLWVTDMKKIGLFETKGTNGQTYYQDGDPHIVGTGPNVVHANGEFSTCEILFQVSTTSTNTSWHDEWHDARGSSSSSSVILSTPVQVTNIQTNWPGSYNRGSEIPLADLGNYKILLSVK